MKEIAGGDRQAVGKLYDCLGDWVYTLAHSIVRNASDAEEVTQEVFLTVWQQADRFSLDRGTVRAWLAVMTRHLAIDRTRSRMHREPRRSVSPDSVPHVLVDARAEGNILSEVAGRSVLEALDKLAEMHRQALYLSYYEGFSHSEIAGMLEIPLGTVKSRIRSGMDQLRQMLDIESK
jgi:RNA polymerase sigma-70 factor (ECF subfamily)